MACYKPLDAWMTSEGSVVFHNKLGSAGKVMSPQARASFLRADRGEARTLKIRCGRCIGCRIDRSKAWAVRCMHESQMHAENCFVTLTYDDDHLPYPPSLVYEHFQGFMKRLRAKYGKCRFYMAGEYGEQLGRPHYHALIFGHGFLLDRVQHSVGESGEMLFRSEALQALWPFGFASVGDVTFRSAGYVARYCMKKVVGSRAAEHYTVIDPYTGQVLTLEPELSHMSLKPGIGATWFEKYHKDVTSVNGCVVDGKKNPIPRYYEKMLSVMDLDTKEVLEYERYLLSLPHLNDTTEERLLVREIVASAKLKLNKRNLK